MEKPKEKSSIFTNRDRLVKMSGMVNTLLYDGYWTSVEEALKKDDEENRRTMFYSVCEKAGLKNEKIELYDVIYKAWQAADEEVPWASMP